MGPPFDEETAARILRQVEFYFSDSNLPCDKFLLKCLEESQDGLVSLPLICSFSRMRSHLDLKEAGHDKVPLETTAAVAEILCKSSSLRVSDDGQKVGRRTQLLKPDEVLAIVDSRSIAAGPLPWNVTMEEVEAFFCQHAKVNSVRLPRHFPEKVFCGCALIEFSSEEDTEKVLGLKLTYEGADLELRPKRLFDEESERNKQQHNQQFWKCGQLKHNSEGSRRGETTQDDNFPKGLIVAFSLRKVAEDGNCGGENTTGEVALRSTDAKEGEDGSSDLDTKAVPLIEKKTGENEKLIRREDIRDVLKVFGNVKYVDYTHGGASGYVRFELPEGAQKARAAAALDEKGGLAVNDHIATLEAVEGDAEKEYWLKLRAGQDRKRDVVPRVHRDKPSNKRGRNWNVGGREGKRNNNRAVIQGKHIHFEEDTAAAADDDDPPSKILKTE
eukprot:c29242_g2_i1 orf=165-1493(+)